MSIGVLSKLQLNEETELAFNISVTGTTEQTSSVRLCIEGSIFDIVLHGKVEGDTVKFVVPKLKSILESGVYGCKMEIIIDDKVFTPLNESLEFLPLVEFSVAKTKDSPSKLKETVTVTPIKNVSKIDEALISGFSIKKYKGYNLLVKDNAYHGIVSEHKMIIAPKSTSTIEELIESLN